MRNKKLIPFETIEKAVAGEPEAIVLFFKLKDAISGRLFYDDFESL